MWLIGEYVRDKSRSRVKAEGEPSSVLLRGHAILLRDNFRQLGIHLAIGGCRRMGLVLIKRPVVGRNTLCYLPQLHTFAEAKGRGGRGQRAHTLVAWTGMRPGPLGSHGCAMRPTTYCSWGCWSNCRRPCAVRALCRSSFPRA